jgi:hypothetical protein
MHEDADGRLAIGTAEGLDDAPIDLAMGGVALEGRHIPSIHHLRPKSNSNIIGGYGYLFWSIQEFGGNSKIYWELPPKGSRK